VRETDAIILIALHTGGQVMAQILVRGLDEGVVERLKDRARKSGRSLQSEVKLILEQAALEPKMDMATARKSLEELHRRFKGRKFPDSVELIREDRDR
jgi:plasmid stability protein